LIRDAIRLAERRETVSANYLRQAHHMEDRLIEWLMALPKGPSDDLERFASHVQKHRAEWLAFLFHPEVPPTVSSVLSRATFAEWPGPERAGWMAELRSAVWRGPWRAGWVGSEGLFNSGGSNRGRLSCR